MPIHQTKTKNKKQTKTSNQPIQPLSQSTTITTPSPSPSSGITHQDDSTSNCKSKITKTTPTTQHHQHHHHLTNPTPSLTSKPSLFTKSHHTLLAVASLNNLRNSNQSIIKRSNSIGEQISNHHHHHHYITHSTSSSLIQPPNQPSKSFNYKPDFFKRSKPTHSNLSTSHLNLEILPNHSTKLNPHSSNTSFDSPSTLLQDPNQINLNLKPKPTHHHLTTSSSSIKSESNLSSSSLNPSDSIFNKPNEPHHLKIESDLKKKNESFDQKHESLKQRSDLSTSKQKSDSTSNSNSTSKQNSDSNSNSKSNSKSTSNRKKESISSVNLSSLGLFSGPSTTSLVSTTSSSTPQTMNFSNNNPNPSAKPVIRHMTSTNNLSSTNLSTLNHHHHPHPHNGFGSKSDPNFGLFLGNGGDSGGSLVLRPGDIWSQIVMRVIPLFNGEGHKGFIEDLNEFVVQHITKTISDSPSKSIQKLTSDLQELFTSGVISLNHKFSPDSLNDERFLIRLMEIWHFFFTGVLPTLEAIFLPLMIDEKLISVLESKNNKLLQERLKQLHLFQQVSSTSGLPPSSTALLFNQTQSSKPNEPIKLDFNLGIEVRKLALISFRDSMINGIFNRLYKLCSHLYDDELPNLENLSMDLVSETSHYKRLQMIGLLCASVPNPEIEALGKLIRSGKTDPKYLKEEDERSSPSKLGLTSTNPTLTSTPTIRNWKQNREFTRRSIRRQLGKSHHPSKPSSSNLKTHLSDLKTFVPNSSSTNSISQDHLDLEAPSPSPHPHPHPSNESQKFSEHLKHVVQAKINKSMNYFGSLSLDEPSSIHSPL
ncbi:HbrB-like-domain-containing protein [Melampsora americana]|nr:HbrB-like-domain-containing protein [Melampsora americana]